MFRLATLLLYTAAVAVAAPVPKAVKKDSADGVWEVTDWQTRGNKMDAGYTLRWTIDGEKLTVERTINGVVRPTRNSPTYALVKADQDDPKAVDYTVTYPRGERVVSYLGRRELDGDTLKYCYDADNRGTRPAECKPGEGVVYFEFKRVKAESK